MEAAAILVDASSGVQVGTEKAWNLCKKEGMPRFCIINKTDKENVDVSAVVEELKEKFGTSVATLDDRDALSEAIAETDEELMEKFFDVGEFTDEEFAQGLINGIGSGDIAPVLDCSAVKGEKIAEVLDAIVKYVPTATGKEYETADGETVKCDPAGKMSAFVFKTIADPFLGKISLAKVISGKITPGVEAYNTRAEKAEKLGSVFFLRGNTQGDAPSVSAGDIIAFAKLQYTQTGDTLCDKGAQVTYPPIAFPEPSLYKAIEPADKGDDEKVGTGLHKLMEEDPSFSTQFETLRRISRLLGGQGDLQLGIINGRNYKTELRSRRSDCSAEDSIQRDDQGPRLTSRASTRNSQAVQGSTETCTSDSLQPRKTRVLRKSYSEEQSLRAMCRQLRRGL